jgi:metal-responsive CopG/Arc/MetJ family transcriptional regulator
MRTIVDLPEEQLKALASIGKREKVSRAELIRRAVAEYLRRLGSGSTHEAFGIWRDRGEESLDIQNRLRDEWNR